MRVAVISDIHANYKAFEAFLAYIEEHPVDAVIGLGDYVTDCPYPERTMQLLYDMMKKYPCHLIRGNREEYLLDNDKNPQGWHVCSPNGALYYTSLHVTRENLAFFNSLPSTKRLQLGDCPELTICHGAPEEIRGNFEFQKDLKDKVMRELPTKYLLGGHSHHQEATFMHDKLYVNPGALGLAIDFKGAHAEFAILEGDREGWKPQLISIPYDLESFLEAFAESGLNEYGLFLTRAVKKTLRTGRNYFYEAVCEACKISGKPLAETDEDVWQQVAERLGL